MQALVDIRADEAERKTNSRKREYGRPAPGSCQMAKINSSGVLLGGCCSHSLVGTEMNGSRSHGYQVGLRLP